MLIWMAEYPRSGCTFFRIILKNLYGLNAYSLYVPRLSQYPEEKWDEYSSDPYLKWPATLGEMGSDSEIYIMKTHQMAGVDNFPAVCLVRDGRDAMVSHAHYILTEDKKRGHYQGPDSFEEVLHDLITTDWSFGGWSNNVSSWLERKAPTKVVRFEELISRPQETVSQAVEGLGLAVADHELVPIPSFEQLHQSDPQFFRRGKAGSWRDEMPKGLHELFWERHGDVMKRLGYSVGHEVSFHYGTTGRESDPAIGSETLDRFGNTVQLTGRNEPANHATAGTENLAGRAASAGSLKKAMSKRFRIIRRLYERLPTEKNKCLRPRLGRFHQYPPRPLAFPKSYGNTRCPADIPVISIVSPTLNGAQFLDETIRSVIHQNYSKLEYVIQDGGSSDGTSDVIDRYEKYLTAFESVPDRGQAHALNSGFKKTSGEIMAYLNSDDLLLPGTLHYVASFFQMNPDIDVLYGHRIVINEIGQEVGRWILPRHTDKILKWVDYVPQETLFWRRSIWEKVGGNINENFYFALDWDLILRFLTVGAGFVRLPRFLGAFRVHAHQKSAFNMHEVGVRETAILRERCHGRPIHPDEIFCKVKPYLMRHVMYNILYSVGILRY